MITNWITHLAMIESNCKSKTVHSGCQYALCHTVIIVSISLCLRFEKMISDKYQGVIVCLVLKDLIDKKELFGGESSPIFDKCENVSTHKLSTMEGWYVVSNIIYSIGSSRFKSYMYVEN